MRKSRIIPGTVDSIIRFGGWPQDNPEFFAEYDRFGITRNRGRGYQYIVALSDPAAASLILYLDSVYGALNSMSNQERGTSGNTERAALRKFLDQYAKDA